MKDPAFLFYTKDFQSGTQDMSCEEVGAYIRLLMYQHQHGFIPNDTERMMRITGIFSTERFEMVWQTVKQKFNQDGNHLVNQRLAKESTDRALSKPKKYAASVFAGLVSSAKSLTKDQMFQIKKSFVIDDFLNYEEPEMNIKIREWFQNLVNQMVNNLANGNGDANAIVNEDKGKEGTGEKPIPQPKIEFQKIIQLFNSMCPNLPSVQKLTPQRTAALKNRIQEVGLSGLGDVFQKVSSSSFLNGENDKGWQADFDWILKPANFQKIIEGKYGNRNSSSKQSDSQVRESINSAVDIMLD